ncbi:hypothetical protein BDZ89DRAFT_615718 [Hymenopellis radicata]|nr:hypothetical protein BDZ89DRAFT_615718 [Hymenopellis radicata]
MLAYPFPRALFPALLSLVLGALSHCVSYTYEYFPVLVKRPILLLLLLLFNMSKANKKLGQHLDVLYYNVTLLCHAKRKMSSSNKRCWISNQGCARGVAVAYVFFNLTFKVFDPIHWVFSSKTPRKRIERKRTRESFRGQHKRPQNLSESLKYAKKIFRCRGNR